MTTKFHEMCDRCYSEMIVECDECKERDKIIEKLVGALKDLYKLSQFLYPKPDIPYPEEHETQIEHDVDALYHTVEAAIKEAE